MEVFFRAPIYHIKSTALVYLVLSSACSVYCQQAAAKSARTRSPSLTNDKRGCEWVRLLFLQGLSQY